ncbi:MAG: hypothetical protein Q4D04_06250 [Clostridia bacterium]|nr:hypothetical protein [Clostridia bacterium]
MDEKKVVATFDEEIEVITLEQEDADVLDDEQIEEIDTEELSDVEASGGADGDWVTFGRYSYMVVVPRQHYKCALFTKGPNRFPREVRDNTCSACTRLFKHKGYWLCAKSKTEL